MSGGETGEIAGASGGGSDPLPTGTVSFLFTDIVGSTALWDHHPLAMTDALAEHDERVRSIVERAGGYVFTTAGDSFAVAFPAAPPAVESAVAIQLAMNALSLAGMLLLPR